MPGEPNKRAWGTLGAVPAGDQVEFRVWAPSASSVGVRHGGRDHGLDACEGGTFEGTFPARAGDDYLFVLDRATALPDPCSRFQPDGVHGPSRVVDVTRLEIAPGPELSPEELVLYELHVGAFSEEGTFDGVIPHLAGLHELGVTAIELMPVGTFPGRRNWGYDGLYTSAPHPVYGGPQGLARLVDAAHREKLGVVLDVVYNHIGPGADAIAAFGPYFTDRHRTFWGDALDYAQRGVREWAIQNAELWVRDYRVDGLRLDATHAVFDDSPLHVLAELKHRVDSALVISEMEVGDWRPLDEWGHDAQWADASHHELHVLLTGERDGYYHDYGSIAGLERRLEGEGHPPERLVVCAQNHDQVGNRAVGDRLPPDALMVAAGVTLFSNETPLLFMGEEYAEPNPFQFFTDHDDPLVADATREGRRAEFAEFAAFAGEDVPDPQSEVTFLRSKLSRVADESHRDFYRRLLALRRELPRELEASADDDVLRLRRGKVELVADFDARTVELRGA
ncbi:MAG TPA: alpha-amylase family glycosyl hydrolase [Gaiellaceae bacterium]